MYYAPCADIKIGGIIRHWEPPHKPFPRFAGRHGRHIVAVGDLHAGLSAGGFGDASLYRGADCAPRQGASSRPGSTLQLERSWCRSRVLSGLARDVHTWQAVVAVGIEVHLWRMEVRLWRPLLVRAQPRRASLERAPPDFAHGAGRCRAQHAWHLHPL